MLASDIPLHSRGPVRVCILCIYSACENELGGRNTRQVGVEHFEKEVGFKLSLSRAWDLNTGQVGVDENEENTFWERAAPGGIIGT